MLKALIKKEVSYYFYSPTGYIFALLFLGISSWLFLNDFFVANQSQIDSLLSFQLYLLTLFIPALTMGALADEKRNGTWELLLTMGINDTKLVLAKFMGALLSIIIFLLLGLTVPLLIAIFSKPDLGLYLSGYLGLFLILSAFISVALFASSLSSSSVVAFLISATGLLLNSLLASDQLVNRLPPQVAIIVEKLSLMSYMQEFNSGIIDFRSVATLVGFSVVFLILTVASLDSRNA